MAKIEVDKQLEDIKKVASLNEGKNLKYCILTMGCQLNENDSEKLCGMMESMNYTKTDKLSDTDLIVFNTCCVRENAEDKLFGKLGEVKKYKEAKGTIIAIGGCMMQEKHIVDKLKQSYPFFDIVFGTHTLQEFPTDLYNVLCNKKRIEDVLDIDGDVIEGLPISREDKIKASVTIMNGCNNFCSYCIVPYVRGRERSREPRDIINEVKKLAEQGYKEITLLGQNVNSYGKNNVSSMNFAGLLREINALPGDFTLRFMTSHPKDCTKELIDTMAECDKVAKHLHLPFQSGNDRVLKAMNRHYDRAKYLELVNYAKEKMPDISLTSDVIVGFPGETYEEFLDTVSLIKEVEFTSLFTFIYSRRTGTKAAELPDPVSREEKGKWFKELCDVQEEIAARRTAEMDGKTYRVLVEGKSKNKENYLSGRTDGNIIIEFPGDESLIGDFCRVKVTESLNWILRGELEQ